MAFWEFLGYQQDFISSYNGPLGTPKGGPKVQKWVSDADPINIGQLDHYVSFGTKSGAVQDFQRSIKCLIGDNQAPLDHPIPPKPPKPLQTSLNLPATNLIPLAI